MDSVAEFPVTVLFVRTVPEPSSYDGPAVAVGGGVVLERRPGERQRRRRRSSAPPRPGGAGGAVVELSRKVGPGDGSVRSCCTRRHRRRLSFAVVWRVAVEEVVRQLCLTVAKIAPPSKTSPVVDDRVRGEGGVVHAIAPSALKMAPPSAPAALPTNVSPLKRAEPRCC